MGERSRNSRDIHLHKKENIYRRKILQLEIYIYLHKKANKYGREI